MTRLTRSSRCWHGALVVALAGAVTSTTAVTAARAQSPGVGVGAGPRRVWSFSVDAGSQYDSNVRFGTQDEQGDLYRRISGAVSGGIMVPRGRLELDARGDVIRYDELRDLDRITYDFGMRATRAFTERFSGSFGARLATSVAGNGGEGIDLPVLPLTVTHSQSATASASWRASPTVTNTNDISHTRISFDSPGYVGGSTTNGRVQMTRRLSAATSVGVAADGTRTLLGDQIFVTTGASGDLSRAVGSYRVRLRAGGALLATRNVDNELLPIGDAEVRRDGVQSTISLRYAHGVTQTFGVGRALATDQVNLSLERRWRSGATWRSSADQSWSNDPSQVLQDLDTSSGTSELRVPLVGGVWIGAGAFLRRRVFGDAVDNRGVFLSVGFLRKR